MKTIEEQIKVMQHFANGGKVEVFDSGYESWEELENTDFNWGYRDYRIKKKKQTVTIEKWLVKVDNDYKVIEASSGWFDFGKMIKLLETYEIYISSTEE